MITNHGKRVICRYLTKEIGNCIRSSTCPAIDYESKDCFGRIKIKDTYKVGDVCERLEMYTDQLIQKIKSTNYFRTSLNDNKEIMIQIIYRIRGRDLKFRDYITEVDMMQNAVNWYDVKSYTTGIKLEGGETKLKHKISTILKEY